MWNSNRTAFVKALIILMMILGVNGLLNACARNMPEIEENPTREPLYPKSFKGYELYTWEEEGILWFTMITGTNREKGFDEVVSSDQVWASDGWLKVTVQGIDQAMKMLDRLSPDETLILMDLPAPGNGQKDVKVYPPQRDIIIKIEAYCLENGLQFISTDK